MTRKAILFIDLDDTIFQTKRKNERGIIQSTIHDDPQNISYMTNAQDIFTDIFFSYPHLEIIPVTARNTEQYSRTHLSKDKRIKTSVTSFGADIILNGSVDKDWLSFIDQKYLEINLGELLEKIKSLIDQNIFNINVSNNRHIVIKHKSKDSNIFQEHNTRLRTELLKILDKKYLLHFNSNYLSIIPEFIDKKSAVSYLIKKLRPDLTIGAGDSISDYGFMSLCDYKIIPTNSQIEKLLLSSLEK